MVEWFGALEILMTSRWSDEKAAWYVDKYARKWGEDLALRVYTSRLIGGDPHLVLHGGGNTSVKSSVRTLLGDEEEALFVKGSGWNLADIEPQGLPAVNLAYLRRLTELEHLSDEDMVNAQRTHLYDASSPNPSIETLLHAFLPYKFIDHSHADAILTITNQPNGAELIESLYGDEVFFVPYVKPGFDLAKMARELHTQNPGCSGMVLLHHGLFTWGTTARESYERHVGLVHRAQEWILSQSPDPIYPASREVLDAAAHMATRLAPLLRGALALDPHTNGPQRWVVEHRVTHELLAFVEHDELDDMAHSGLITPDHVIRTKPMPMVVCVDWNGSDSDIQAQLDRAIASYRRAYDAYFDRHAAHRQDPLQKLDSTPRVVLVPGAGLFAVGETVRACGVAADIFEHTAAIKLRARHIGPYLALPESDLFDIEYWSLEQAKLGRKSQAPLASQTALVTSAGSANGLGIARKLLNAGANVVLSDSNPHALREVQETLGHGARVIQHVMAPGTEHSISDAFRAASLAYGGVDIIVAHHSGSSVDTQGELEPHMRHLVRYAQQHMARQRTGGHIVFVTDDSDTRFLSSPALQLSREGVYVNHINPSSIREAHRVGEYAGNAVVFFVTEAAPSCGSTIALNDVPSADRH